GQYFSAVYIFPGKTVETFLEVLKNENIFPEQAAVIGDSIPADINPALEIGMTAILIPYHVSGYSWPYEDNIKPGGDRFIRLKNLTELIPLLLDGKPYKKD
ncbi:MAG: HAD hydrolase-like protein, partial [Candidatus Eremiobacteraeota bacterium]|nr:HAD hydrolase-like protein [Candidatus Eremiobacteraeota bacterium]